MHCWQRFPKMGKVQGTMYHRTAAEIVLITSNTYQTCSFSLRIHFFRRKYVPLLVNTRNLDRFCPETWCCLTFEAVLRFL